MSFFQNPSFYLQTAETDIVKFFATVKADVQIAEQDFLKVLDWLGTHGQEIATDIGGLASIAVAAGIGIPAPVEAAVIGLNAAVNAVNAAVAAHQAAAAAGQGTGSQSIAAAAAGYQALKQAQIQTATAQAVVAASGKST